MKFTSISYSTQNAAGTGWLRRGVLTDGEGKYEIAGLWRGVFFLYCYGESTFDHKEIALQAGERREVNFDFSSDVTVTGILKVNGEPVGLNSRYDVEYNSLTVRNRNVRPSSSDGKYSIKLPPGIYNISIGSSIGPVHVDDLLNVTEGSEEITKDIDITLVDAEVVASFPEGAVFSPGDLTIAPRMTHARYNFLRTKLQQENRFLPGMTPAEFQATFISTDKKWQGESEWTLLGPGKENKLVVNVRPSDAGAVVYTWNFGDLDTSYRPVTVDVTHLIASKGTLRATIRYQRGRHAVTMESAELLEDGNRLSMDRHDGWSGFDQVAISYRMPITQYEAGRRYELRVSMRSDGGTESAGNIYAEFTGEK